MSRSKPAAAESQLTWNGSHGRAPNGAGYRVWSEAGRGERRRWYVRYFSPHIDPRWYGMDKHGEIVWSGIGGDARAQRAAERDYKARQQLHERSVRLNAEMQAQLQAHADGTA